MARPHKEAYELSDAEKRDLKRRNSASVLRRMKSDNTKQNRKLGPIYSIPSNIIRYSGA